MVIEVRNVTMRIKTNYQINESYDMKKKKQIISKTK